jgi:hypothetical protein
MIHNPTLGKNKETTCASRFQQFLGKTLRDLTTACFAGVLSANSLAPNAAPAVALLYIYIYIYICFIYTYI